MQSAIHKHRKSYNIAVHNEVPFIKTNEEAIKHKTVQ